MLSVITSVQLRLSPSMLPLRPTLSSWDGQQLSCHDGIHKTFAANPQFLCCDVTETGSMWSDGRISIGQCDLVESWDNLSLSQKKNLNYRYQMGCECRVSEGRSLSSHPCSSLGPKPASDATREAQIMLCLY